MKCAHLLAACQLVLLFLAPSQCVPYPMPDLYDDSDNSSSSGLEIEDEPPKDDVHKILKGKGYNRHAYPNQDREQPTEVYIQMYIEGMSSFRAQTMDFQLDIYFQEKWEDHRLQHNKSKRILVKDPKLFSLIWHPDLYFANARTAEFHHVTMPNFFVWIYPNGTVWYDCRVSMTVLCMQNLELYPMDTQACSLRILSYAYDDEQIVIKWNECVVLQGTPIGSNPDIRMPDMILNSTTINLKTEEFPTGNWSAASVRFVVKRELMHHVLQSYVPTTLIVIISWFSFWLDVEAVPGRVSLAITTLLTLATQSSAARMSLPQASYVKAIDVWMGACMAFVFSAMIEFTVVNYCTRRKRNRRVEPRGLADQVHELVRDFRDHQQERVSSCQPGGSGVSSSSANGAARACTPPLECNGSHTAMHPLLTPPMSNSRVKCMTTHGSCYEVSLCQNNESEQALIEKKHIRIQRVEQNRKVAQLIDRRSRLYFPLAFTIFNAVYWWYYLLYRQAMVTDDNPFGT